MSAPDPGSTSKGRRAAWDVLCAWLSRGPATARLGSAKRPFPPPELEPRERAFAKALAEGVVRRFLTLDSIVRDIAKGKEPRPAGVRAALLLGAQQLLFENVPARSAVHESVTLARRAAGEGGARFANAILRKLASTPRLEDWIPTPDEELSDPDLAARYWSLPVTFVTRWTRALGPDGARSLFDTLDAPHWLALRTNGMRTDPDTLAAALADEGIETRPGFHPLTRIVAGGGAVLETRAFARGLFSVQDSTQTEIVDTLALEPGQRVLDYCAAPGGKTTAIAEAMRDTGEVYAWDTAQGRLQGLPRELDRLGLRSVRIVESEGELHAMVADRPFDRVLVDAPCSNTGVLGRRAEARWHFDPGRLPALAARQREILTSAAAALAPGGRLVYSTCSIEPEENEEVAAEIAAATGLRLVSTERVMPEAGLRDGAGVSVFSRGDA